MICQEVQLQLSAFLEKSLDPIRVKGIEAHLNSCPPCRAEANELSDCMRQLRELPALEPPAGFAARVMARVREIESERRRQRWSVLRLPSGLPISAAAAVLIAVLSVFIYQKESGMVPDSVPPTGSAMPVAQESASVTEVAQSVAPAASAAPRRAAGETGRVAEIDTARVARASNPIGDQGLPENDPGIDNQTQSPIAAPRRAPIQAQEVATGRSSFRSSAEPSGFGAAIGALNQPPFRSAPFPAAERAFSPLSEPNADIELIVRRRAWEQRTQVEETTEDVQQKRSEADAVIASAAARRAVPAPGMGNSSIVEMRWFGVPAHLYGEFRNQLAAEAHIDSERPITGKRDNRSEELLIKVIILPSDR